MDGYSSYGTVEDTLPHIERAILDNGEFMSAREVRTSIIPLRQEAAE